MLFIILNVQNVYADRMASPNLGQPTHDSQVKIWNRDIFPDGDGLPSGSGTAIKGKIVYENHCQMCHGVDGTGDSADELAGAQHTLTDDPPDKIIGTYWPYATTIFDFTHRSMPLHAPGILSNNELYAVTAYVLFLNGIVDKNQVLNKKTLTEIKMPNRNGFINSYYKKY
jgi:cytochrome c